MYKVITHRISTPSLIQLVSTSIWAELFMNINVTWMMNSTEQACLSTEQACLKGHNSPMINQYCSLHQYKTLRYSYPSSTVQPTCQHKHGIASQGQSNESTASLRKQVLHVLTNTLTYSRQSVLLKCCSDILLSADSQQQMPCPRILTDVSFTLCTACQVSSLKLKSVLWRPDHLAFDCLQSLCQFLSQPYHSALTLWGSWNSSLSTCPPCPCTCSYRSRSWPSSPELRMPLFCKHPFCCYRLQASLQCS